MTLCGVCAGRRPPTDRYRHDQCASCGAVTECGVFDDAFSVPISPRAVPPASGLRRWGRGVAA